MKTPLAPRAIAGILEDSPNSAAVDGHIVFFFFKKKKKKILVLILDTLWVCFLGDVFFLAWAFTFFKLCLF